MFPAYIDKSQLPKRPGVYIFKDNSGKVLYVGKAINLYHRVSSYFNGHDTRPQVSALLENIKDLETIEVLSELEALILEANLIKKYLPPYNIRLTDDKDYLYIKITNEDFPKVLTARKKELSDSKEYFGPFPSGSTVRVTLKKLRRLFPWCNSELRSKNEHLPATSSGVSLKGQVLSPVHPRNKLRGILRQNKELSRPCFYYHLGLCPGSCAGKVDKKEYGKNITRLSQFLQGKTAQVIGDLQNEMEKASKNLEFERAQSIKKTLVGLEYLTQVNNANVYLENPNFVEDQNRDALESLKKDLNLPKIPERIECYDISNISGQQAVGSLVVLTSGEVDKKWYRRFKILAQGKANDVGMMKEVLQRRIKHKEWPMPDLILVDGGRGQVRAANFQFSIFNFQVAVFGLAKKMEWLYTPGTEIIKLPKDSKSLLLLQKIRNEAHRFALSYHQKLRSNSLLYNGYNK